MPASLSTDSDQRGLDRRTLIKRAAVTGALVWTAPIVVDSLASPAAALSVPCGCYKAVLDANCTLTFQNNNDCSPSSPLCPTVVPANTVSSTYVPSDFCLSMTLKRGNEVIVDCDFRLGQIVTVTIGAACNCTVAAAQAKVTGQGGCVDGTIAPGSKSVSFNKGNETDLWKSFSLIIKCC